MPSQTDEAALETHITQSLTHPTIADRHAITYEPGQSADFDREFALDTTRFWRFLETTQPAELAKLHHYPNWQRLILERLDKKLKKDGILHVLKRGLRLDAAHLTLLYSQPRDTRNPEITRRYHQNIFSVTRQLYFSRTDPTHSIDLAVFINGFPIATLELKNPWTGQTVHHARKQYTQRDPAEPLFQFARCVVHFAVDTEEVWMSTRLDGPRTHFLPFNQGTPDHGKGNPVNPYGHRSAYLWDDILQPDSLSDLIEHYALLADPDHGSRKVKPGKNDRTLFFPRYHQRRVVRKILHHARRFGPGQRYLIQHSAGSGKSNSIAWTVFQLIELPDPDAHRPLFDSVVVVTDRRILDKQLRDNIREFSAVKNLIAHAERAQDLKNALETGKKIIITTLQKFPYIVDTIDNLSERRFAVIIDEAHSSQSGNAADKLNITLGDSDDDEQPEDPQDLILRTMEARKLGGNASYLAFTATPKNITLEKFGKPTINGGFEPFDLYAMKQAIEEGFILDVLANYTTYKSYYEIQKSIRENPLFDSARAQQKLRAYVEGHPDTIATKAEIMVAHFLDNVWGKKKLRGQARAMVITRNIESAIRYFRAIRKALQSAQVPFQALVAFSGQKILDGQTLTEDDLNGFPGKDIPERFRHGAYRLLVVANKFLTGFDEPLLHTLYVDKKLQGVMAVQALSRLNRCNPRMDKQDTFVLDFFNTTAEIRAAFEPFYTATTLSEPTDVNVLHDLKEMLDDEGVYEWAEVEAFNGLFFEGADSDRLAPLIDVAAERFHTTLGLEEEKQIDFKIKAKQFVKIYGQMACIIPFNNVAWEQLHWFLKFLIPKLKVQQPEQDQLDQLLESVDLSTYGLERLALNQPIQLDPVPTALNPQNPNPRGYHGEEPEQDSLDEIIRAFNERHFQGWDATPQEQRVKMINILRHVVDNPKYRTQVVDNPDEQNRRIALEQLIQQAVNQERRRELDLYRLYANDAEFRQAFEGSIIRALSGLDMEKLLNDPPNTPIIQETPGVCGGYARIRNTRIPVWTLVSLRRQGADDAELLRGYPGLSDADLAASWDYYERHRQEIDRVIESHQSD